MTDGVTGLLPPAGRSRWPAERRSDAATVATVTTADPRTIERQLLAYYADEMAERASRPLEAGRLQHVRAFADLLRAAGAATVLEIGCGAGRDGTILAGSGASYLGTDISPEAVRISREQGLEARVASATDLPLPDGSVDAVWSMSTLMHLTDRQFDAALAEIARVVSPGGIVELGVWGREPALASFDEHGRYFNRRTDKALREAVAAVGEVEAFDTWHHGEDGHRYQWARIRRT